MRLYVESSAVLAALLGEPAGERARRIMAASEILITSELTLIECDRALVAQLGQAVKRPTSAEVWRRPGGRA